MVSPHFIEEAVAAHDLSPVLQEEAKDADFLGIEGVFVIADGTSSHFQIDHRPADLNRSGDLLSLESPHQDPHAGEKFSPDFSNSANSFPRPARGREVL